MKVCCKMFLWCQSVRGMGEQSVFVKRRSYCTLSSLGTLAPNMCLFYFQLCLLKLPLGLCLWQGSLLLEEVNKLLIPREGSHFLLNYFQAVWKEKSIVCWDIVSACCRTHKLLMSLSSLSSDNFSEHADRETLFKDVQSSRKVSVSILMISHSFLIFSLAFLETQQAAKCKGLTPFLCINPFPSLTSCAAWLLTLLYSLFCHWAKIGGKWGPVICKRKEEFIKEKTLVWLVSHLFTTLWFIFREVIHVSIWKYPFSPFLAEFSVLISC